MPIPPETLNAQLVARETHTGVFLSKSRRIAVVVKTSKDGKVHFLHWRDSTVQIEVSFREKFLTDYPVELYHYPALRAVRHLAKAVREGFYCTPEARKIINAILVK